MKLRILVVIAAVLLASCAEKPVETFTTTNQKVDAELLFSVKGADVYRFKDNGEFHYFVLYRSGAFATTNHHRMAGKAYVVVPEEIPTVVTK